MSVVVNITHETGDLTQYTTSVTDSGDLSVSAAAALAGTGYGLSCLLDDATAIYGAYDFTKTTNLRFRFYVDPNTLTMAGEDQFTIARVSQSAGSFSRITTVQLKYVTGTGYRLYIDCNNDAGSPVITDIFTITDAPHYVEVYVVQAASAVSSDGTYQWWVDGVDQGSFSGIDNYNLMSDQNIRIRIGQPVGDVDAGTSGTFYLDELLINNDGGTIGPVVAVSFQPRPPAAIDSMFVY